jgi:hypothetical protein
VGEDLLRGVKRYFRLLKLTIPSRDRKEALKALNRMNINHQSLYPDVEGAARYCNISLTIRHYDSPDGWVEEPDPPSPVSEIAPPEPIRVRPVGFEFDSETLLVYLRKSERLQRLDKRLCEARGQVSVFPVQIGGDQPEPLDYLVGPLRSAGLVRTGDLDRLLDKLDEDQLVAFLLKRLGGSPISEGGSIGLLAHIALARQTTETGFLDSLRARGIAGTEHGPSESLIREFYTAARQIAPPVG